MVSRPVTASAKSMVNDASTSAPRRGWIPAPPPPRWRPPRPNMPPRTSPMSPTLKENPSDPPCRPPIMEGPMRRTSSYSARLSSSPSTSYAAETSLNFSSATSLPGILVWVKIASKRTIRLRDLLVGGTLRNAQRFIEVFFVPVSLCSHSCSPPQSAPLTTLEANPDCGVFSLLSSPWQHGGFCPSIGIRCVALQPPTVRRR